MKLYFAQGSVASAISVALFEADLPFEACPLDFSKNEQQSPDFLAVNPKGRVPALVTDQGVLTETGAILEYIAATSNVPGLMPDDLMAATRLRAFLYYLASTVHINHAHMRRGYRWADQDASYQDMQAKVPETMSAACQYIEDDILTDGPFVMGQTLTIGDPYLFTICGWLAGDGVDIANFPRLSRFFTEMRARASVQQTIDLGFYPAGLT